jgi:hypothetical protein
MAFHAGEVFDLGYEFLFKFNLGYESISFTQNSCQVNWLFKLISFYYIAKYANDVGA